MAIPFAFPSDEDTDANYQRLDQLLSDLFGVVQQILITQRRIRDAQPSQVAHRIRTGTSTSNPRRGVPDDPPPVLPTFPSAEQLFAGEQPVPRASAGAAPSATNELLTFEPTVEQVRSPNRRRRRRRRTSSESSCCCEEAKSSSVVAAPAEDWTQDEPQATDDSKRPCGVEATSSESLLSMLVPAPFSGSLWTAVIFVVGWRLLARTR